MEWASGRPEMWEPFPAPCCNAHCFPLVYPLNGRSVPRPPLTNNENFTMVCFTLASMSG